ncbi:hypothetical protein L345_09477 [Ophiophagus hannah]|uniref:Uncharacterized protein n=1 Tax=Ophiophagus hannah TaxID=8665 RepID=V8NRR3_OPHHA|nr:hypothetical protein L345_09477 [Ophiophagus hannah]
MSSTGLSPGPLLPIAHLPSCDWSGTRGIFSRDTPNLKWICSFLTWPLCLHLSHFPPSPQLTYSSGSLSCSQPAELWGGGELWGSLKGGNRAIQSLPPLLKNTILQ